MNFVKTNRLKLIIFTFLITVFMLSAIFIAAIRFSNRGMLISAAAAAEPNTDWYTNYVSGDYQIGTADELAGLSKIVSDETDDFFGKSIILTSNINLSDYGETWNGGKGWIPIGTYNNRFKGNFNGNNKIITGLYIKDSSTYKGLFGIINGGTVSSLSVSGKVYGHNNVGGITGWVEGNGLILNCYSDVTVSNTDSGIGGLGGIAGFLNNSRVVNSISAGKIVGKYGVGGITYAVYNGSSVENCYFIGSVTTTDNYASAGGIAATVDGTGSIVKNCYSTGTVEGHKRTGGITGDVYDGGSVINCYSTGAVSGTDNVGGIAGYVYSESSVKNCAALNPSVTGTSNIGRVAGYKSILGDGAVLLNNIAFDNMSINKSPLKNTHDEIDGESKSGTQINAANFFKNLFNSDASWTYATGKLPGFGTTINMPAHIAPPVVIVNAQAPNITAQPQSAVVTEGITHNLTITAASPDGGTLSCQWYKNTKVSNSGGTSINGATGLTYAAPINEIGIFYYYVIVKNTIPNNGDGGTKTATITSNCITLTVNEDNGVDIEPPLAGGEDITPPATGGEVPQKTKNSITIPAVAAPSNGQKAEYGYSKTNNALSVAFWQEGTVFNNLAEDTTYYIFARSKENDTFAAGEAKLIYAASTDKANGGGLPIEAVIAIIIGCVIVAGLGGFALCWFAFKKKAR